MILVIEYVDNLVGRFRNWRNVILFLNIYCIRWFILIEYYYLLFNYNRENWNIKYLSKFLIY